MPWRSSNGVQGKLVVRIDVEDAHGGAADGGLAVRLPAAHELLLPAFEEEHFHCQDFGVNQTVFLHAGLFVTVALVKAV